VFTFNQIREKYENEAKSVINLTSNLLDTTFQHTQRSLISLKNYLVLPQNINSDIYYNETLSTFKNVFRNSSTLFIAKKDGTFYLFPKRFVADDYDPRTRTWYTNSTDEKGTVNWTEPYIDHGTGEFTITASKYVGDDMVIGVDILLSEITNLVNESKIGSESYVTIVNDSGIILATNSGKDLAQNWDDIVTHKTKINELIQNPISEDSECIYYTKHLSNVGMLIIVSIDKSEITGMMLFMFLLIFLIGAAVIFIAERLSIKYSDSIVEPILKLVRVMEHVEEDNYYEKCEIEVNDSDVKVLIDGFNSMITSINEKNFEMQALYEELYASEETLQEQYDLLFENKEYISKSEQRYKSIFEASEEGLWDLDINGQFHYLTPNWYSMFDIDLENSTINSWIKLIHPEDRANFEKRLDLFATGKIEDHRIIYRVLDKNGDYIWIEAVGIARYEDDQYVSMSGSHQNITSRKEYEFKIHDMAYKDTLTKLYNRRYFEEKFTEHLSKDGAGALLLLDIDNFKYINDIYGHTVGDEILKQFANRLLTVVTDQDKNVVARFSGNEFVVLTQDLTNKEEISAFANSLCKMIEAPFNVSNKIIKISASIGITIYPLDGDRVEQLVQNADIAMYHARRITKKSYHYFNTEILQDVLNEMKIENHMRSGIEEDEFEVYYQPIMSAKEKTVKGFEALVRWNSKSLGFIFPDSFIPIAEKTGLIIDIGSIVLEKSCAFLAKLNRHMNAEFTMSINISVIQLMEEHFANNVLSIISKYDIPKHLIRLEITESMMLESNENIIAKLFYLRNHQVGISLDDFGTGYSSFKNLIRLPLNGIKIDKTIMKDSISNEHVFTLLESIVDFAHKTNIDVVAEGIESDLYFERSLKLNVDFVQGYLFSKPVSELQVVELLSDLKKLCEKEDTF
jgi:diguanylate cyclase (GGDEF)-like protein/PAS domain S-box-containing protein